MKNAGNEAWPEGVTLAFVGGRLAPDTEDKSAVSVVPQAKAGETVNITVKVRVPTETGRHCGYYRLQTKDGHRFGQRVWVDCLAVPVEQTPASAPKAVPAAPIEPKTPSLSLTPTVTAVEKKKVEIPAAVQPEAATSKYATQLRKLKALGFRDEEMLTDLLIAAGGNVQQVIDWLVQPVV